MAASNRNKAILVCPQNLGGDPRSWLNTPTVIFGNVVTNTVGQVFDLNTVKRGLGLSTMRESSAFMRVFELSGRKEG